MIKILLTLTFTSIVLLASNGLKLQKINNNVYAIVGELDNRSPSNFGNNSTHGVIITNDGVILIDAGASYKGAKAIDELIHTITNKKVKILINTGGQDHRWLGNDYFKKQGAKVIASKTAVEDQKQRVNSQLQMLDMLAKPEAMKGTIPYYATKAFEDKLIVTLGQTKLELYSKGAAHTKGDIFIWLEKHKIVFAGDIVFTNRVLGVNSYSDFKSWIKVFEQMAELKPLVVVPGHGKASSLEIATNDTYNYLKFLEKEVEAIIENDGEMFDLKNIDHKKFYYLHNADIMSKKNAQSVFTTLEF